jgi:hypothetical protein
VIYDPWDREQSRLFADQVREAKTLASCIARYDGKGPAEGIQDLVELAKEMEERLLEAAEALRLVANVVCELGDLSAYEG